MPLFHLLPHSWTAKLLVALDLFCLMLGEPLPTILEPLPHVDTQEALEGVCLPVCLYLRFARPGAGCLP